MAVFGAFLIYTAMRGSLSTYIGLLFGPVTGATGAGATGAGATAAQALAPLGTITDLLGQQDFSGGVTGSSSSGAPSTGHYWPAG
jgi:hypothetical protein